MGEGHGRREELGANSQGIRGAVEESPGVWETVCIESVVRNWRDPTLHSENCKEVSYKPKRRS